jgi:hypothetical protein
MDERGNFMRKKTVYFLVALLMLSVGLISVPKAHSQTQNVKILSHSWYVDQEGILDVVGEIRNVGNTTLSQVYLTGSVYAGTTDLDDSACQAYVSDLIPGQSAPFYIEFYEPQGGTSDYWDPSYHYTIYLNVAQANATNSYQYQGLTITSHTGSIGTFGNFTGVYLVNGEVKNTGNQAATNVYIVGTFYNSTGGVVAVGYTNYLTPTVLEPSQSTTFQVAAFDLNQSQVPASMKIYSYQLLVQTQAPILTGTPPNSTSNVGNATSTTSPTSTASSSTQSPGNQKSSSIVTTIAIVVIVVVVLAIAATAAMLMLKRNRSHKTVKEARKVKKHTTR